jgi:hypothetical protein
VQTPIERWLNRLRFSTLLLSACLCGASGCGEPSQRELKNRQEFEMLLTAVSLRNAKELEKDARRIDARHEAGQLSDSGHRELGEIIAKARSGDWGGAEKLAYEFREQRPYFK